MESFLVGEGLWDVVCTYTRPPKNNYVNNTAFKEWKQKNDKAEFILKSSISSKLFDHIVDCKSARSIWETLNNLFNTTDEEVRLRDLENEVENATQCDLTVSHFFLRIKELYSEIKGEGKVKEDSRIDVSRYDLKMSEM